MKQIDFDGIVEYGHNVNVTYFAQDQAENLDTEKTVYQTVDDVAKGDIRKDLRTILGTFLFGGEDVDKKVSVLSGGERTRLALCQLLLSPSNVLILDEPTNHLDIQSKEVLKRALQNYEGTFIIVSHDREFLNGLTNRIWDIEQNNLKIHHFTLNEYLSYKMSKLQNKETIPEKQEKSLVEKTIKKEKTEKSSSTQNTVIEKEIKSIEKKIAEKELQIKSLDEVISNLDFTDEKSNVILKNYETEKNELSSLLTIWEEKMLLMDN